MNNAGEAHGEHVGTTNEGLVRLQTPAPTNERFRKDGYFLVEGLVSKTMLQEVMREIVSISGAVEKNKKIYVNVLSALGKLDSVNQALGNYFIKNMLHYLGLKTLLVHPPVVTIMSDNRISAVYYGTVAHQDWASTQGSLDCITVWIALTDAGVGNFPLEVIPGSHLDGLKEGVVNGSVLEIPDAEGFIPLECKAGDVVFMSGFLIHRTGSGSGFRVAVSQRFDNAAESTFIERGYPCAQKRVVDREIKWRPTVSQVRGVYGVD